MPLLKVLELFSGIGGMHSALKESQISAEVVGAVDINTSANEVYKFNFPNTNLMQRNIEALSAKEIEGLAPDMILMSPPCQPFTRSGKQQGLADTRSMPLIHFMDLVPHLWGVRYILLENVVGFESSIARHELVQILQENLFHVQEFHLTPKQFSIPNSRPRYYLLAKRKPWKFSYDSINLAEDLPVQICDSVNPDDQRPRCETLSVLNKKHRQLADMNGCYTLSCILQDLEPSEEAKHAVPDKLLERYIWECDLVGADSSHSCCFTKAYRRYYLGSGSIVLKCTFNQRETAFIDLNENERLSPEEVQTIRTLGPRFFTPTEMLRLMCFPDTFSFPPSITIRQASSLLGNSINVHVVALLIAYLTEGDLGLE